MTKEEFDMVWNKAFKAGQESVSRKNESEHLYHTGDKRIDNIINNDNNCITCKHTRKCEKYGLVWHECIYGRDFTLEECDKYER